MADTTWGVKMDEEQKKRLLELIERSGMNAKEFMADMIRVYEVHNAKKALPVFAQDFDELNALTRRIGGIYLNLVERITTFEKEKEEEYTHILQEKEADIEMLKKQVQELTQNVNKLQEHIATLEQEKEALKAEKIKMQTDFARQVERLQETIDSNKALLDEYKEKNSVLIKTASECQGYKEEIEKLKRKILEAESSIQKADITIKNLTQQLKNAEDSRQKEITQHKEEINELKEKMEFEKEKALLEQEKKFQEQINMLHKEYNDKIRELLKSLENSVKQE